MRQSVPAILYGEGDTNDPVSRSHPDSSFRRGMKRHVVTGEGTPAPMAHYCQGVMAGDTLYAAGQIASDYKTGVAPEARQDPAFPYYGSDIQKQARYVLKNLRSVFQAAGCDFRTWSSRRCSSPTSTISTTSTRCGRSSSPRRRRAPPCRSAASWCRAAASRSTSGVEAATARRSSAASRRPRRWRTTRRACSSATRSMPRARSPPTTRPASRRRRARIRRFPITGPTSRSRRAMCSRTCAACSRRPAASSRTWSSRRFFSPT